MDDRQKLREATKSLVRAQKSILKLLDESPKSIEGLNSAIVSTLKDRKLVEIDNNQIRLTKLGHAACELLSKAEDDLTVPVSIENKKTVNYQQHLHIKKAKKLERGHWSTNRAHT